MKVILIAATVLAALILVLLLIGLATPKDHVASVSARIERPDSVIWAVVSDAARVPEWFSEVKSAERIADVDGRPAWREDYGGFRVTNVERESVPNRKLVREILPEGSFSGTWTIELVPDGSATRVTVTERGHVGNALFRAMMRIGGYERTMRAYLAALQKKVT